MGPREPPSSEQRRRRRALRILAWRYRPLLLAVLAAALGLTVLQTLRPAPEPGVAVVTAGRDLPAGAVLTAGDLALTVYPDGVTPPGAFSDVEAVVGLQLAHPISERLPLTPVALVERRGWGELRPDEIVVAVRLADAAAAELLPLSGALTLVSATGFGATELTSQARLLARVGGSPGSGGGGLLGDTPSTAPLLLLAVPEPVATLVLDASAGGSLSAAFGAGGRP